VLRERGIVSANRVGTNVYYQLRSPKIVQTVDLLREFLAEDLAEHGRLSGAIGT
jgi:DNA-binding transcriptional ArsR family regulator